MLVIDAGVASDLMRPTPTPRVAGWIAERDAATMFRTAMSEAELRCAKQHKTPRPDVHERNWIDGPDNERRHPVEAASRARDRRGAAWVPTDVRDWCGEMTNAPREMAEAALRHNLGNVVEQAFARSDLLEKRPALMEFWARYLVREAGDVIQLPRMA